MYKFPYVLPISTRQSAECLSIHFMLIVAHNLPAFIVVLFLLSYSHIVNFWMLLVISEITTRYMRITHLMSKACTRRMACFEDVAEHIDFLRGNVGTEHHHPSLLQGFGRQSNTIRFFLGFVSETRLSP